MISPNNSYSDMQRRIYNEGASRWSLDEKDHVVGSFDAHNAWEDYNLLFDGMDTQNKIMLDFGCGPGRNIVKFNDRFARIDGADISLINLEKAQLWATHNGIPSEHYTLYETDGVSLNSVPSDTYDVVMSTITFQHIPVYEIRKSLMRDIHRVLVPDGWFTAQMGFGDAKPDAHDYFGNLYDAASTNGNCDVRVINPFDIESDLLDIGFTDFSYEIRPVGPGDNHSNWIFFRAKKRA